ncbi:hypothetical protein T484DRAFT_2779401 [Baffinella frigidus]|nr:hypothetical protein T484DRAFT_2779401 [Cryptophyta sp. CCMP2293]
MSSENKYVPLQGPHGATSATARDGLPRGSREELTQRHMGASDGGPPDRQWSGGSRNDQREQRDCAPGNPHPRGTWENSAPARGMSGSRGAGAFASGAQGRTGGAGSGGNNSAVPPAASLYPPH